MKKIPFTILFLPLYILYISTGDVSFEVLGVLVTKQSVAYFSASILLFVENLKSSTSNQSVMADVLLSIGVSIVFLILIILIPYFRHEVFVIFTALAFFDAVGGLVTAFRTTRRDINVPNNQNGRK